jgi:hypothetical protein
VRAERSSSIEQSFQREPLEGENERGATLNKGEHAHPSRNALRLRRGHCRVGDRHVKNDNRLNRQR